MNLVSRRRRAFTLIEILVVVAIIALLVTILLPSLARAREQSKRAVCASNLHQMGLGCLSYASAHKGIGPFRGWFTYTISEIDREALGYGNETKKVLVNYGLLYGRWMVKSFDIMYCPSDNRTRDLPRTPSSGGTYGGVATVWDRYTRWTFGTYNYAVPLAKRGIYGPKLSGTNPYPKDKWSTGKNSMTEWVAAKEQELGIPPGSFKVPTIPVLMNDWAIGAWNLHQNGLNALYADGHVKYHKMKNPQIGSGSIAQYELWYQLSIKP